MTTDEFKAFMSANQGHFRAMLADFQGTGDAGVGLQVAPGINLAAVRLPTFWMAEPELWFMQVEANFENRTPKITTDSSKFSYVLQTLPQDVLSDCQHAVCALGPAHYDVLKAALIKAYGRSAAKNNASSGPQFQGQSLGRSETLNFPHEDSEAFLV